MNALDDMLSALSVSRQAVPGVEMRVAERDGRLDAEIVAQRGARIEAPIHGCIGFLGARGEQRVAHGLDPEQAVDLIVPGILR